MGFSKNFFWGAATSATQIEGAWNEGGRTASIWDALSDGHIVNNENAFTACDSYHLYKEDIALMKQIGLKSYRFSVSWSRVIPAEGKVNQEGLAYYNDLVDELVKNGIEPMVTLYHWDMPMWVYEKGGWMWECIAEEFCFYVKTVVKALSDRVSWWFTLNEPQVFVSAGYKIGSHAPFEKHEIDELCTVSRNALLTHGKAVLTIRANAVKTPKVGFGIATRCFTPREPGKAAIEEARQKTFDASLTVSSNTWWADPMVLGTAPEPLATVLSQEDMKIICQKLDFFAFNSYRSNNYASPAKRPDLDFRPGMPRTPMNWFITPEVLYWLPKFMYERYQLPVLITENGMANLDFVMLDGKVHDPQRSDFIKRYLSYLKRAADEGVPVLGYQYWSLLDNFEWQMGYDPRFGLVYVDYLTQKRALKDSAYTYAEIIRTNGENLPEAPDVYTKTHD